jgi:tRNA(fMet)-specific endonuclease VapC
MRFLLDTNIVSSPASVQPNARIVSRISQHSGESAIPAPVWHELTYGCLRLPKGKRREALATYLEEVVRPSFLILPYDDVAASWHAAERERLERLGKTAPYVDGQIAAIACASGLTLVTMNLKDFRSFEGLRVEDWSRPSKTAR